MQQGDEWSTVDIYAAGQLYMWVGILYMDGWMDMIYVCVTHHHEFFKGAWERRQLLHTVQQQGTQGLGSPSSDATGDWLTHAC